MSIASGAGAVLGTASGIQNLAHSLAARLGGSAQTYFQQLNVAKFRGVRFVSLGGASTFGRRVDVHEYPYRDKPWAEDLGRATRHFAISGYLVGDDVIQQRDMMIAACELDGVATLMHPTFGELDVTLLQFRTIERWDKGRYFELEFEFVEAGQKLFPSSSTSTISGLLEAVLGANAAASLDFVTNALTTISVGAAVLGTYVYSALGWYTTAKNVVVDARNLFRLLTNLPGDFGRFAGGSAVPAFSTTGEVSNSQNTVSSLTAQAVTNRAVVDSAGTALMSAAAAMSAAGAANYAAAAADLAAAVLAAAPAPDDAVRLLISLSSYSNTNPTTSSNIGIAMASAQGAASDLFRRACVAAVAQASSQYQPTSSDDAAAMRDTVTALIDAEIVIAGDQGADNTYDAMKTLRAAVVADLNTRGAALAAMKTFQFAASLPALVLANRMYRDAARADEIVGEANPVHPAFMPLSFKALSV
ncbi:DNA circularization N-terminal domain-containing protein [Caballeronia sp. NK8]|uniref:DNA circularization protein n=1 Tax=Caballeronia sp. NK8 TaxID=140098 RepID=UPI001BB6C5F9|nr:DNA circularization N-terminal domain-containing protein [Caballeronia sp. NK8]BCQ23161.1 DNA circularization N-terminal domain-containing protein [Caballeronia sp. NK8]